MAQELSVSGIRGPMLSNQEVFDKVAIHLLTQGQKSAILSKEEGGLDSCLYHSADGLKCAVGCLIPDNLYIEDMEGRLIQDLFVQFPSIMEEIGLDKETHLGLLTSLQNIHDTCHELTWYVGLTQTAPAFDLNTKELQEYAKRTRDLR